MMSDVSGLTLAHIASFTVIGQEAAAAGRVRDAEAAFLMSCRVAEKLSGADSVEDAGAKYQLGAHYARVALSATPGESNRSELLKRAEQLHAHSLRIYELKLGQTHEKSRFASEGLMTVRQTLAQDAAVQRASVPEKPQVTAAARTEPARPAEEISTKSAQAQAQVQPQPQAQPQPQPQPQVQSPGAPVSSGKSVVAKAVPPSTQNPERSVAQRSRGPSFDCNKARSTPEKIICADPELSQLDRDLGRLYSNAKKSTSDHAAFRRQQEQEWAKREATCRDRQCLVQWYERRRIQLVDVLERRNYQGSISVSSRTTAMNDSRQLYKGR